ncbi:MAG: phage tail protein [Rhizobiales bacterium]|nr:phage tail protein [Hyphomicrobiales bacterium]
MARQPGIDLLIKRGNADGPPETFSAVAGLKDRQFNMNTNEVDTTAQDVTAPQGQPVQKTSSPGIQTRQFSGSGNFEDDAAGKAIAGDARTGTVDNYQVIVPGFGTFEGPMYWTDFSFDGPLEGDMEFSGTLVASAVLAFTAV